ncbi:DUF5327 family protein [Pseudogracilibacillus sp. SE30717A]|uniref:DUF5327 family protein n=1 Tax=Pseudogracilibacillus sp. SE30717A TaxID=3098293 RepID=UPI00300E1101
MVVSSETIINKMQKELEQAKKTSDEQEKREHISKIKLLCELLLEENKDTNIQTTKEQRTFVADPVNNDISVTPSVNDDDGTSIFDF